MTKATLGSPVLFPDGARLEIDAIAVAGETGRADAQPPSAPGLHGLELGGVVRAEDFDARAAVALEREQPLLI